MPSSILNDIKKMLGLDAEYDVFDTDVIININSVFMTLNQLGVGPKDCFSINGTKETWDEFDGGKIDIMAVKTYIYLKVRLLFDPPQNSFTISALENQAKEFEWRLLVQCETRDTKDDLTSECEHEVMTKEDIDNLFESFSGQTKTGRKIDQKRKEG